MTVTDGDTEYVEVTEADVVTVTEGVYVVDWVTVTDGDTEYVEVTDVDTEYVVLTEVDVVTDCDGVYVVDELTVTEGVVAADGDTVLEVVILTDVDTD